MGAKPFWIGLVTGALLLGGIAFAVNAAASSPSTTYYGCLAKGRLTSVGTTSPTCKASATAISWNSVGPAGPQGPPGASDGCGGIPHVAIDLSGCDLEDAYLSNAALIQANLSNTDLLGADLVSANLNGADLTDAQMSQDKLLGADLVDTTATGTNFTAATLDSADLQGADLTGANLESVQWSNTTCPDGTNSNNDGGTCVNNLRN